MTQPQLAPYGTWRSPITSDLIVADSIDLNEPRFDGTNIFWLEHRPKEAGRVTVIQHNAEGKQIERTLPTTNVRTRVHEYGGGAYAVAGGTLYFSNFTDQRIYRQSGDSAPEPLTPTTELRYADYCVDTKRNLLFCVREDHRQPGEAINTIAKVNCAGDAEGGTVLVSGNDFYSSPRLSPNGQQVTWLTWNHPNMPWDGCELWLAELDEGGSIVNAQQIAGGKTESIFQPQWSPEGVLYFVSDRTGWWNLYRWRNGIVEALCPMEAEFGLPSWVFAMSTYAFASAEQLICTYTQHGFSHLTLIDTTTLHFEEVTTPYTQISAICAADGQALFLAGSAQEATSLVKFDLRTRQFECLQQNSTVDVDAGYLSIPQAIEFPTESGLTAYAFFYPPQNKDFVAPDHERPPLLVISHGGPTYATDSALNIHIQYWTSRGVAVIDVNYGGSSGYGRAYRQRLNDQWGIVDVDDCTNGALYLVAQGKVDGKRLMITGGSAGGYTTLCALAFRNVFKAGASHYGVGDPEALARDTHKFESRYLDSLIGPYPAQRERYIERAPIHHADQISCPLILFQGDEDRVVPPEQSRQMFDSLKYKELPVAYLEFAGEQHGFRKAENIKRSLDAELYFYSKVFGFTLGDAVEPVEIENL
ncbi:MAG: S9 family peptidase [Caldilineaceae bacterium]